MAAHAADSVQPAALSEWPVGARFPRHRLTGRHRLDCGGNTVEQTRAKASGSVDARWAQAPAFRDTLTAALDAEKGRTR